MTLEIKKEKKKKIHNLCLEILQKEKNSLRLPASVIGNFEFTIHPTKSILTITHTNIFLGFMIDSVQMTLKITEDKKKKIHNLCLKILQKEKK